MQVKKIRRKESHARVRANPRAACKGILYDIGKLDEFLDSLDTIDPEEA